MLRAFSVIACLLLVALAVCCGSSQTGTIAGHERFIGGPVGLADPGATFHRLKGRGAEHVLVLDASGDTVAEQRVARDQEYRFQVAPHRYRLALAERGGRKACPRSVRVRQGETKSANVTCQIP